MRRWWWLCAVEAATALVLVLAMFGQEPGTAAADPTRASDTASAALSSNNSTRAAEAGPGDAASTAWQITERRPEPSSFETEWNPGDPLGVVLRGTFRDAHGLPVEAYLRVHPAGAPDRTLRSTLDDATGAYCLPGMTPGVWTGTVVGTGIASETIELELGSAAVQRRDFVVARSHPLRVRVVTSTGENALPKLAEFLHRNALAAAAGPTPCPAELASTPGGIWAGDAEWQPSTPMRETLGTLRVRSLPAHAALLLGNLVVARAVVAVGEEEVTFTVDPTTLLAKTGQVVCQVTQAATGAPIEGARVAVARLVRTDAKGAARLERVVPGRHRLTVVADGLETYETEIDVRPGTLLDLGGLALARTKTLRGVVLDRDGNPVKTEVRYMPLKWWTGSEAFPRNRAWLTNGAGELTMTQLGPGPVLLHAGDRGLGMAISVVDHPSPDPVVLRLTQAGRARVTGPGDPGRAFVVNFFADRRFAHAVAVGSRGERWLSLPYGTYGFEVRESGVGVIQSGTIRISSDVAQMVIQ